jgi:hypothetical protein
VEDIEFLVDFFCWKFQQLKKIGFGRENQFGLFTFGPTTYATLMFLKCHHYLHLLDEYENNNLDRGLDDI